MFRVTLVQQLIASMPSQCQLMLDRFQASLRVHQVLPVLLVTQWWLLIRRSPVHDLTLTPEQDSLQLVLHLSMLRLQFLLLVHSDRVPSRRALVMIPAWLVARKQLVTSQGHILVL
jgi:hypothetical protein